MAFDRMLIGVEFFQAIDVPIFIKNTEGVYVYCNEAFLRLLGKSASQILGATAYDIAPRMHADVYAAADQDLFASRRHQKYSAHVQNQTKNEERVVFNKSIIYDRNDSVLGFIGSIESLGLAEMNSPYGFKHLTGKEMDVLNILAQGAPVKGIAQALGISAHTVRDHLKSIYLKLDVHSRGQAVYKFSALMASQIRT